VSVSWAERLAASDTASARTQKNGREHGIGVSGIWS
jgi:hypothetical protein